MSRREEILRAAQDAFLRYGVEKITLDDIAQECGIKKSALYYYFKNKEEILVEMLTQKMNGMTKDIREEAMMQPNVKEKLRTYMKTKVRIMKENLPFISLFDKENLPFKAKAFLEKHKLRIMEADFCLVKEILKQGVKNKNVSYKLDDSLVLMIMGVTYGTFIGRFLEKADWDPDAMIDTSIDVIFKGIE